LPVMNAGRSSANYGTVGFRLLRGGFLGGGLLCCLLGRLGAINKDLSDADGRQLLTVSALAARILTAALLEGDDLRTAALLDDLHRNAGAFNNGGADLDVCAFADSQHFSDLDDLARLACDL